MNAYSALSFDLPDALAVSGRENPWHRVRGLQAVSLCDWPNHLSLVLFCGGCNLRCPTCHNAALAWQPARFHAMERDDVAALLHRHRAWYQGIVVSGGEATVHPQLQDLLEDLNRLSVASTGQPLPIKLDTNGMAPDYAGHLLRAGHIDTLAVDVKGCYEHYPVLTGNTVQPHEARTALEACYALALEFPQRVVFRLTQVPSITDQDIATVRSYLPTGHTLTIQAYVPPRTHNEE